MADFTLCAENIHLAHIHSDYGDERSSKWVGIVIEYKSVKIRAKSIQKITRASPNICNYSFAMGKQFLLSESK